MEGKHYVHLPMSNVKSKVRKLQREYIKERDKIHTQNEISELAARIDTLDQVLKLFPE